MSIKVFGEHKELILADEVIQGLDIYFILKSLVYTTRRLL